MREWTHNQIYKKLPDEYKDNPDTQITEYRLDIFYVKNYNIPPMIFDNRNHTPDKNSWRKIPLLPFDL